MLCVSLHVEGRVRGLESWLSILEVVTTDMGIFVDLVILVTHKLGPLAIPLLRALV